MELIDVVDENGLPTGEIKTKKEVHQFGLWHKAPHIWIINSHNDLLIQKRSPDKETGANQWDISAAGHVSSGEIVLDTAIRELEEELGIVVDESQLKFIFTIKQQRIARNGAYLNNEINDVYLVELDIDLADLKIQESELTEVKWIKPIDLKKLWQSKDPSLLAHDEEYEELFRYLGI